MARFTYYNVGGTPTGVVDGSDAGWPYNPNWGYHLAPESIQFFDAAIEVCDAHPYYVEEHLDEVCGAFLPGCVWCPFSSRVIAEVRTSQIFLPLVVVDSLAE